MTDSILSSFRRLRASDPDRRVFTFVDDKGDDEASFTVRELGEAADRVVESLRGWGFTPGDRAILASEELVLFVETRRDKVSPAEVDEIIKSVRRRVYEEHQLGCHAVVVGRTGIVRKTTSGKVRRLACKQAFLSGEVAA